MPGALPSRPPRARRPNLPILPKKMVRRVPGSKPPSLQSLRYQHRLRQRHPRHERIQGRRRNNRYLNLACRGSQEDRDLYGRLADDGASSSQSSWSLLNDRCVQSSSLAELDYNIEATNFVYTYGTFWEASSWWFVAWFVADMTNVTRTALYVVI